MFGYVRIPNSSRIHLSPQAFFPLIKRLAYANLLCFRNVCFLSFHSSTHKRQWTTWSCRVSNECLRVESFNCFSSYLLGYKLGEHDSTSRWLVSIFWRLKLDETFGVISLTGIRAKRFSVLWQWRFFSLWHCHSLNLYVH